ncbi:MAG: XRE family transcriptional regulator [Ruminococcus sp.]|nr:XRE family transcriptional regulator [Ruminococcus sp.]MBQ4535126.1 XRE family transcriptional regulator [Ruminococcus sp.]MBR6623517.1 XRE family transcriptional regulator [Ruminococcus sp.]
MARIIDGEKKNMIGKKVRQFRIEQKMSQQTLADKLETIAVYICRGSICRIEEQTRTVSDIELWGLSIILEKPIGSFFEEQID